MHTGHIISGAGHLALIGWMFVGGLLRPDPEPFEVQEVSVISGADFAAMIAAQQPPQSTAEVAQPAAPEAPAETPEVPTVTESSPPQPAPPAAEQPDQDPAPEVTQLDPPAPAEVEDTPPDPTEPPGDVAVLVPEVAPEAAPRPVERVAPEPVAQPQPEATPDPVEQEAVAPDAEGEAPEQEAQEATAPEEAVTEVVTEATQAPAASPRPPGSRPAVPSRPTPAAPTETAAVEAPAPTDTPPAPSSSDTDDAVRAALQAAEQAVASPSGPPLSAGERDSLKAAIARCWNVGALSTEAKSTIIVVALDMNQNGTPVADSIRFVSSTGGSSAAAQRVFNTARSAIIRCGSSGFDLPQEKYGQWRKIEITFDPSKMGF